MAGPFKMVNLARSKESLTPKSVGKIKPDPYSYEHRITLNQDHLDKLGIDMSTLKPGDSFHVMGHGEVVSMSQNASKDSNGGKSSRVELQLKRLGLKKKSGGLKSAVESGISQANESD